MKLTRRDENFKLDTKKRFSFAKQFFLSLFTPLTLARFKFPTKLQLQLAFMDSKKMDNLFSSQVDRRMAKNSTEISRKSR